MKKLEKTAKKRKEKAKTGPIPERVKIRGNWEMAIKKALKKSPPA